MAGVGEHEAPIPDDLVPALRRRADELGVPLSSVLLAAHAKVLAALSGEARSRPATSPDRAATVDVPAAAAPASWRELLLRHASDRVATAGAPGLSGR